MAHEDKETEIDRIEITRAENGFVYKVRVDAGDGMDWNDYVYENIEDVIKAVRDDLGSPHYRKDNPPEEKLAGAFHELKKDEPEVVAKTRQKSGKEKAKKQLIAIAFSKAKGGLFNK